MAIRYLKDVPVGELPGKFVCPPRPGSEVPHGWPAVVTKASRGRLTYQRLLRGEWDAAADEWRVLPWGAAKPDERLEAAIACVPSHLMLVCDTSEEAIALYVQALRTQKAIREYQKASLAAVVFAAVNGGLAYPDYLPGARPQ